MDLDRKHRRGSLIIVSTLACALFGACSSAPRFTSHRHPVEPKPEVSSTPEYAPPERGDSMHRDTTGDAERGGEFARGEEIVKRAEDYLGTPYRTGGTTLDGVDCSGLTFAVYHAAGVSLPRTSDEQARAGEPVSRDDLEPGDLVFFGYGSDVSHVGIYAGGNEFIHASTRTHRVRVDRLDETYFRKRYVTARRVL